MATASTTATFSCTPDQFFGVISDYEKYPEFIGEVKQCRILESKGDKKLVEFHISLIKSFSYRLWLTEERPTRISWTLASGDLFKTSEGSWEISADQSTNGTVAKYAISTSFKIFVPGPVAKALVGVNLPNMMRAYQTRVKELYG